MIKARKAIGDKVILDDVTMAFFPGAKIGMVGPNGAGKSSILKIMAGLDEPSNGEARLTPGYSVGILMQEPVLDETKTVIENVRLGAADIFGKLARFNEISEEMANPDADFDALMDEMGKLQTEIDAANAWDIDSQLDQAMDALRCPRRTSRSPSCRVVSVAASRCASSSSRRPICSCSMSPRTTWTPNPSCGSRSTWPPTRAPSSPLPTTATSLITSPAGSPRLTAVTSTPTRVTTRPTWRPRRSVFRSRARRMPSWPSA